jgi:hypothetical protein
LCRFVAKLFTMQIPHLINLITEALNTLFVKYGKGPIA